MYRKLVFIFLFLLATPLFAEHFSMYALNKTNQSYQLRIVAGDPDDVMGIYDSQVLVSNRGVIDIPIFQQAYASPHTSFILDYHLKYRMRTLAVVAAMGNKKVLVDCFAGNFGKPLPKPHTITAVIEQVNNTLSCHLQ